MKISSQKLISIAEQYAGKPYISIRPQMACIFLVLDILSPLSAEFRTIRKRLKCMDITASRRSLITQYYFLKFIRTTRLRLINPAPSPQRGEGLGEGDKENYYTPNLQPGDILLLNYSTPNNKVDHLGLYLGQDKAVWLKRIKRETTVEIIPQNILTPKLKAIARGRFDG